MASCLNCSRRLRRTKSTQSLTLRSLLSFLPQLCRGVRCVLCNKRSSKAYCRLSPEQKEQWMFIDGQLVCVECLFQMEKADFTDTHSRQRLFNGRRKSSVNAQILKKVESGKAWDRTTSFNAPYKESPAVTAKLSRLQGFKRTSSSLKEQTV